MAHWLSLLSQLLLDSVQDGGGPPLRFAVERAGDAQPGLAEHPAQAHLERREESAAAGAPVLEAEHFPFLRQAQVAAEALAPREADGGGRRGFHGGRAARPCSPFNLHLLYSGHPHITVSPIVSSCCYLSFAINPSHGNCVLSRHAQKRASAVLGRGSKRSKVFNSPLEWFLLTSPWLWVDINL